MAVKKKKKKYKNNNRKNKNNKKNVKKINKNINVSKNINKNIKNNVLQDIFLKEEIGSNNGGIKLENRDLENKELENDKINLDKLDEVENIDLHDNNNKEDVLDNVVFLNEDINKEDKNVLDEFSENKDKKYKGIFLGCLIIVSLILIILFFPRIKLLGEEDVIISYKDSYVELGYNAYIFKEDISSDIEIDSNLIDGVVGDYQIKYYLDKFGIRFYKTRDVSIVDNDNPKIEVDSDVINVCPNEEIPKFEYKGIDEYDGDITSKVEKIILEDEVLLQVKDSSDNEAKLSIKIDREDKVNPVIKLNGDSIMYLDYGKTYSEPGYTVSDNCTDYLSDKVEVTGNVGREIGTYLLTYEVSDDSGNKSSVTRKVIVGNKIKDNGIVNTGTIYLTFDDGPNEGTTNKILDILKDEGVKATFFVTCNGSDSLIKRIYDEGHTIALHTASHDYSYIYSSIDNYFNDLNKVRDRVKRITGYDSKIIRFPGGSSNTISKNYKKGIMTELSNLVLNEGYRYFDWNVDAMDASSAKNSSDVYYNVTANLSINRANVVLMHDTKSITVSALRNIIRYGKENDYQFKEIDMNTKMVRHSVSN